LAIALSSISGLSPAVAQQGERERRVELARGPPARPARAVGLARALHPQQRVEAGVPDGRPGPLPHRCAARIARRPVHGGAVAGGVDDEVLPADPCGDRAPVVDLGTRRVSNFDPASSEISYGSRISALVGWKRFVVDTSRDGMSPRVAGWCNPPGAALGPLPASAAGYAGVDALLWVKHLGESDGICGASALPAGAFDVSVAVSLAQHAGR
jgi:hypothetical protein